MIRLSSCLAFLALACAEGKTIGGHYYEAIGLFEDKDPCIKYEASVGNVVLGIIFVETIAMPVWLFGWELMEPTDKRPECAK